MMISEAIQIVIHINNYPDHSRRITEIIEVMGLDYAKSSDMPPYKYRTLYKYAIDRYDYEAKKFIGHYEVKEPPTWVNEIKYLPNAEMPAFWSNKPEVSEQIL